MRFFTSTQAQGLAIASALLFAVSPARALMSDATPWKAGVPTVKPAQAESFFPKTESRPAWVAAPAEIRANQNPAKANTPKIEKDKEAREATDRDADYLADDHVAWDLIVRDAEEKAGREKEKKSGREKDRDDDRKRRGPKHPRDTEGTGTPSESGIGTVPLPASVWLFGGALGTIGLLRRRRSTAADPR